MLVDKIGLMTTCFSHNVITRTALEVFMN